MRSKCGSSTIRVLPSRSGISYGRLRSIWQPTAAWRPSFCETERPEGDRVKKIPAARGEHLGLVCIFSAMEPSSTYKPWHNKQTGKTYLGANDGKCLHYYFYSSTNNWACVTCEFRHGCPAGCRFTSTGTIGWRAQSRKRQLDFDLVENAFTRMEDWSRAQQIADIGTETDSCQTERLCAEILSDLPELRMQYH